MIKRFLLVLGFLASMLLVKSSEIKGNEGNEQELLRIEGSKQCDDCEEEIMDQRIIESLEKAVSNLNDGKTVDYSDDPASNFFHNFITRSIDVKSTEISLLEETLWEMPFMTNLSVEWHTTTFFVLLNNFQIDEDVLVEYFQYIVPFWQDETLKADLLRKAIESSITKLFLDLFEEILKVVHEEKDEKFGLETLILLKEETEMTELKETVIWRSMCTLVVKKFPKSVYESKLRIKNYNGEALDENEFYIHFLPILRNLMIEDRREFEEEEEYCNLFTLFHFGDSDAEMAIMDVNALLIINQIFLSSKINLSAFKLELNELRQDLIERILFDSILFGLNLREMIILLFDKNAFSIFQSLLKYSKNLILDETILYEIMEIMIDKATTHHDLNFVSALIAYANIPQTVWIRLIEKFQGQRVKIYVISHFEAIDISIKRYEKDLDLKTPGIFDIEFDGEAVDKISELKKKPFQLKAARFFLARVCGIPFEMTEVNDTINESYEWNEAVAFINFYVERMAAILGYNNGDIIKFKLM